jgi:hypothetical protein
MSHIYAQRYKNDPQEKHFEDFCKAKGGRIAQLPNNHPAIEVQKNIFMKQVKALDLDIEHLVQEPNYKQAFKTWAQEHHFVDAHELMPKFLEKIKSYEDPDPDQRDRDARSACEKYQETSEAKYFETFLEHNQKCYIQALKLGKNIMQLQLRDKLYPEFIKWSECPWKGDPYDFCTYLLKFPVGPSGYDNLAWGKTMMKCFYIGDNHWFDTCDRGHQERFLKEADPDNKVELKPIQQMIKDLKKAQQNKNATELGAQVQEAQVPEAPEAPEAQVQEAPEVPEAPEAPEAPAPEAPEAQVQEAPAPEVPEAPEAQVQEVQEVPEDQDLMAQLEKLKKMQANIEKKIALQNEQSIMQGLKPKYQEIVQKINKKRSFQNVSFDFGNLPPTKRAKTFKADINKFIQDAQAQEKKAYDRREQMKKEISKRVNNFFN